MTPAAASEVNPHLDDATLLGRLHALVQRDHRTTARLLWHLGEVDARGLYRDEGYSALFEYCVKALHMSEAQAALRIRAARLSRQFPAVLEMVERGTLHLSALRVLAPALTQDNHARLLRAATHKTKRQVEELVADLCPEPDAPERIRKLPSARPRADDPMSAPTLDLLDLLSVAAPESCGSQAPKPDARASRSPQPCEGPQGPKATQSARTPSPKPLGQQRYRVQFTADRALCEQLRQAQELLRHQVPDGDLATIVGQAMTLLLEQTKQRRFAQTDKPRRSKPKDKRVQPDKPQPNSRHIPHNVRRKVLARDGMRCTFVGPAGHRCEAAGMLEFHHEDPHAHGGPATVDNIRLLCRAHNALMAERDFGRDFIRQTRQQRRPGSDARHRTVLEPSPD